MSRIAQEVATLYPVCPGAAIKTDGGQELVYLPNLAIAVGDVVHQRDGLLWPFPHPTGYSTRLFLSEPIAERPTIHGQSANWSMHVILGRTWHTWSWRDVSPELPLLQMLLAHVAALR